MYNLKIGNVALWNDHEITNAWIPVNNSYVLQQENVLDMTE